MNFSVDEITNKWGRPTTFRSAPADRFEKYAGVVPNLLLSVWQELGFSGFYDGLYWICDPVEWQSVVDEWTSELDLQFGRDEWSAVTRSAFGTMDLWGRRTGMSLTIVPYYGMILPVDNTGRMINDFERDLQILAAFTSTSHETLDPDGDDDRPLFRRVFNRLGPVDFDSMYGFVPVPALGGEMLPERVEILDAEVHMHLLSQVTPRTLLVNNPYR